MTASLKQFAAFPHTHRLDFKEINSWTEGQGSRWNGGSRQGSGVAGPLAAWCDGHICHPIDVTLKIIELIH